MVFCSLRFLFRTTVPHMCLCRYPGRADVLSKNETDFHFSVCFLKLDTQAGQTFRQTRKSIFNFTCVFESGHRGWYGFWQSSIFVLCNSIAHLSLQVAHVVALIDSVTVILFGVVALGACSYQWQCLFEYAEFILFLLCFTIHRPSRFYSCPQPRCCASWLLEMCM